MTGSPGAPSISVVIPARDAADTIGDAITSVTSQDVSIAEVVVAVPPGDAATRTAIERIDTRGVPVVVVDNPSGRTPDALNQAIAHTTSDVIARVDAHSVLPGGYFAHAVATLASNDRVGNVGGLQRSVGNTPWSRAIAAAMQSRLGSGGAAHRRGVEAGEVDTVYLGVFRAEALAQVGGYDSRFTRNQDYELNVRLSEAGWVVAFNPDMVVEHLARSSLRRLATQYWEYGRWRRATLALHPHSARLRQLVLPIALLAFVAVAIGGVLGGMPWLAPICLGLYLLGLLGAGWAERNGSNPLHVALALVVMHASWALGMLVGPPNGWRRRGT